MISKAQKKQNSIKRNPHLSGKRIFLYSFILVCAVVLIVKILTPSEKQIPLGQAINEVKTGKVSEIDVNNTKLSIKEGSQNFIADIEPKTNIYQLFKNANVSLDNIPVNIQDQSGMNAIGIDPLFFLLQILSFLVPFLFLGMLLYVLYLVICALRKYLSS